MTTEEFDVVLNNRINAIRDVLGSKAKEYAQNGDRLFNFKAASTINSCSIQKALWGMATKHLVSVQDLVEGRLCATPEMVNEKIGDMINYLILLEAVFVEQGPKASEKQRSWQPACGPETASKCCKSSYPVVCGSCVERPEGWTNFTGVE